jgi:hypothetical protein
MSDQQQTGFGAWAPFAWAAVVTTTLGIFFGTLYLKKKVGK